MLQIEIHLIIGKLLTQSDICQIRISDALTPSDGA